MPLRALLRPLLLALALLAGAAGPASAATEPEYYGTNLQPLMKDASIPEGRWGQYLGTLGRSQLSLNRLDVNWSLVERTPPAADGTRTYQWDAEPGTRRSMDFLVGQMAASGLRAEPTFTAAPSWAAAPGLRLAPSRYADFGAFVAAFADRYGPGGAFWREHPELPQIPPTHFEIWNEPNAASHSFTNTVDPGSYAQMMRVVYPMLKANRPWLTVLLSLGWPSIDSYLLGFMNAGGGASFDGIGFHPYAPTASSIIGLTRDLRATLANLGRGDAVIRVTETGVPATYTGPGAAHAYDGMVSDAARAAMLSFSADALARSDCRVDAFLVYAVTGSETSAEWGGEGYMGILRYGDGSPSATAAALGRAAARWAGIASGGRNPTPAGRLGICANAPSPRAAMLPLDLSVSRATDSCVGGVVGYDGNPLEGATLVLETADGRRHTSQPDAFGRSQVCIPNGPAVSSVVVHAEVPNIAQSRAFRCAVPVTGACSPVDAAPAGGSPQQGPQGRADRCEVRLRAARPVRSGRSSRSRVRIRATLDCDVHKTTKRVKKRIRLKGRTASGKPRYRTRWVTRTVQPQFSVGLKAKGKKERRVRQRLTLRHGRTVTFTVRGRLRSGDRVVLRHRSTKRDALPVIRESATLKSPKRARR